MPGGPSVTALFVSQQNFHPEITKGPFCICNVVTPSHTQIRNNLKTYTPTRHHLRQQTRQPQHSTPQHQKTTKASGKEHNYYQEPREHLTKGNNLSDRRTPRTRNQQQQTSQTINSNHQRTIRPAS